MVFQIKKINNYRLKKSYEKSMKELDSFFRLNWKYNRPNIILVDDRKTINALKGKKTENWSVGWARGIDVYLLNSKTFSKESNHTYSEKEYNALLKHELTHCFTKIVSKNNSKPIWLHEGISLYLAGQNKFKTKPVKFTNFLKFYKHGGAGVYSESGFAVEFLVKKYGKNKLLKLLKELKNVNSQRDFNKLFKNIYGFELKYENFKI